MNLPVFDSQSQCLRSCLHDEPFMISNMNLEPDVMNLANNQKLKIGLFSFSMIKFEPFNMKKCYRQCPFFAPFVDNSNNCYSNCLIEIPFWKDSFVCRQTCPEKYRFYCISPLFKIIIIMLITLFLFFFIILLLFKYRKEKEYALEFSNIEIIPD